MSDSSPSVGTLVIVCGAPGVGKSTVASIVAELLDATSLRTDAVRTEVFDEPRYTPEESHVTYGMVFERALRGLARGEDVVVDGTFSDRPKRESARRLAESAGSDVRFLRVCADESVVRERIAERQAPREADFRIHLEKKASFDAFADGVPTVDNSEEEATTRRRVEAWVRDAF